MIKKHTNVINAGLLLLSLAITILMCCLTTPEDTTISAMQVRHPVLGAAWALATALAVFFNMEYLQKKNGMDNLCFKIFVLIGSVAALLTPFTMEESAIGFTLPFINLHRLLAVIFAVVIYVALITILISRRKAHKTLYTIFAATLLVVGFVNVYGIFALSGFISALMETCLIIVGLTVLFLANFLIPDESVGATADTGKKGNKAALTAVCIGLLAIMICGITTIPSYHVTRSNTEITQRVIPPSGFVELKSEFFSIYIPDTWLERDYSDMEAYYDDAEHNSISVVYENEKNLNNLTKFSSIQNINVKSAELITYMEHDLLIMQREQDGILSYSYLFNCSGQTINITISFSSTSEDVHDDIFHSLLITSAA